MKFNLLLLCCMYIATAVFGQNQNTNYERNRTVDSLLTILNTAKHACPEPCSGDTTRYNAYINLGDELKKTNPDTAFYFYNLSLQKAKTLKDELKEANSIFKIGDYYRIKSDYNRAIEKFNLSISIVNKYLSSKNKTLQNTAKKILTSNFNGMGNVYLYQGDYTQSIAHYLKALKIAEETGDKIHQSAALGNIGNIYNYQGDYAKALDYYFKALKMDEALGNKNYQSADLGNIGSVYTDQGNYAKALNYYFKALKIDKETGNKPNQAAWLVNIGNVFFNQGDNTKALDYYFKALKINEEIGDKSGQALNLGNIGIVYKVQCNYDNALDYYVKALQIDKEIGDKSGQARNLGNIGALYIKQKKFVLAEKYLNQAIQISEDLKIIYSLKEFYNFLSELYEKTGRSQQALDAYKKSIMYRDSILSEENKKAAIQKEMQYEFEKKTAIDSVANAKAIQVKNLELKEQKAVSSRQRLVIVFVIIGLLLIAAFAFFVVQRLRITRRQKRIIEQQKKIVDEKNEMLDRQNHEIASQRDEIVLQRDEIASQRDTVITQKEQIEFQHKKITDSIHYAKRIQDAVLLISEESRSILGEHFILFKPKDVVSGDFYWAAQVHQWLIITVADCTGHGVPGAFMSMLGISFLNEIVRKDEVTKANHVLNELRKEVIHALQQRGVQGEQKDGMDISLLVIDKQTSECQWAGANNPLYIVKNNHNLIEIKPDKMPIAIYERMELFTNHEFTLEKGDTVYLFSDGFADQFGGPKGKKFKYTPLKELLLSIHEKPMDEQRQLLETSLTDWKGNIEQVDDITIMGIKI